MSVRLDHRTIAFGASSTVRSSLSVMCHRVPWIFGFIFELGYPWELRAYCLRLGLFSLLLLRNFFSDQGMQHTYMIISDSGHVANSDPARSPSLAPEAECFTFPSSAIFHPQRPSWLRTRRATSKDPEDNVSISRSSSHLFPIYVSIFLALASKAFATFVNYIHQQIARITSNF